jgi:hypothetical protein
MSNIDHGMRELAADEIEAVSGGTVSSVYSYLRTVEYVLDKNGGDKCAAPTMVKALDKFLDNILRR